MFEHPKHAVQEEWITVLGGPAGEAAARIVRPVHAAGRLPVILYLRGAAASGYDDTDLLNELAIRVGAAVVSPEYYRRQVSIARTYTIARWVLANGALDGLNTSRIAVVDDSVAGNMSTALALLAERRGDVALLQHLLFFHLNGIDPAIALTRLAQQTRRRPCGSDRLL